MESQLTNGFEFCRCYENRKQKVTWTDAHDGILDEPTATDAEYCDNCCLEVNKFVVVVNYVTQELPKV
ncbi:MAG: hypothetical protein M3367_02685 [Acidobacteriota bacterium]|nr:hypothetical protein [Acidobacteriota bacterium]